MNRKKILTSIASLWLLILLAVPVQLWSQANCNEAPCAASLVGNGPDLCDSKLYCSNSGSAFGYLVCGPAADTDGCGIDASIASIPAANGDIDLLLQAADDTNNGCYETGDHVQWVRFFTDDFNNQLKIQGVGVKSFVLYWSPGGWDPDNDPQATAASLCDDLSTDLQIVGSCHIQNKYEIFTNTSSTAERNLYYVALIYDDVSNGTVNLKAKECEAVGTTCEPAIACPDDLTIECDDTAARDEWLLNVTAENCGGAEEISNNFDLVDFVGCSELKDYVVEFRLEGTDVTCTSTLTTIAMCVPSITCPDDLTIECDDTDAIDEWLTDVTADNCGGAEEISNNFDMVDFVGCSELKDYEVEFSLDGTDVTCTSTLTTTNTSIACLPDNVQYTLSAGACEFLVTPGDVLTPGSNPAGVTIMLFYDEAMTDPVPTSPVLTAAEIGITVYIKAIGPTGISCWSSTNRVEDKTKPQIVCPPDSTDVTCLDDLSPSTEISAVAGFPVGDGTTVVDNMDGTYTADNIDACGNTTLSFTDEVTDVCAADTVSIVKRTWLAIDESGNDTTCMEFFVVLLPDDPIVFPGTEVLECNSTDAPSIDPDSTGYPQIGGEDIKNTANACDLIALFSDQTTSPFMCTNGVLITRSWTVYRNCDWTVLGTGVQIIKIMDTQAPDLTCPDPFTVNASSGDCTGQAILPAPTVTDDCSTFTVVTTVENGTVVGSAVFGLPLGDTEVTITATDDCDNDSTCTYIITAVDMTPPIPVCETNHTIGIVTSPTDVSAEVFDDGSEDYCGAVTFTARRMEGTQCTAVDATDFAETVPFYCCDIGEDIMVELLVEDEAGNTNSCMVSVEVQDKIDPIITCPLPKTIECDADTSAANTGLAVAIDNCVTVAITRSDVENITDCHVGTIVRTFVATDAVGRTASCDQIITVENSDPFDGDTDIACPANLVDPGLDCTASFDPADTGEPVLTRDACDVLGQSNPMDEIIFPENNAIDDFLFKIQRTWTIVDWCRLDDDGEPEEYTCVQFIKVVDNDAPTFSCPSDVTVSPGLDLDLEVTNIADNCTDSADILITYEIDQNFDGTTFTPDVSGTGPDASGPTGPGTDYPSGDNRVIFTLTDDAGNASTCVVDVSTNSQIGCDIIVIEVDDLHVVEVGFTGSGTLNASEPALYNGVVPGNPTVSLDGTFGSFAATVPFTCADLVNDTTTLVDLFLEFDDGAGGRTQCPATIKVADLTNPLVSCEPNPTVEISSGAPYEFTQSDLVSNVLDQCTNTADLTFKFTPATIDCGFLVTNGNNSEISVTVQVFDRAGNEGGCSSDVTITTNDNLCATSNISSSVAGIIENEEGVEVEYVHIEASGAGMLEEMMTTETGDYNFILNNDDNYVITPERDDNPLNGVSTLDLIRINQHILQVAPLGSPYKIIAADINRSGEVTTFDLVNLRKLILHIDTEFNNNTSWRFVDAGFVFPNPNDPFETIFPEVYTINGLSEDMQADFVAIKVGDVNCSASANDLVGDADDRTTEQPLLLQVKEQALNVGETYAVDFSLNEVEQLQGYQFTLQFDPAMLKFEELQIGDLPGLSESNFGLQFVEQGFVTLSWHVSEKINVEQSKAFTMQFTSAANINLSEVISISSTYTKSEAYTALGITPVALAFETTNGLFTQQFQLFQNRPNPFKGETVISFQLPESGEGALTIYDLTGRVVKTIKSTFTAGYNEVALSSNELLGDGVYYYRLEVADQSAMRRMILLE